MKYPIVTNVTISILQPVSYEGREHKQQREKTNLVGAHDISVALMRLHFRITIQTALVPF